MNRLRDFFRSAYAWLTKPASVLRRTQRLHNENIELRGTVQEMRSMLAVRDRFREEDLFQRAAELSEAQAMLPGGLTVHESHTVTAESGERRVDKVVKERFWELELAMEDRGWKRQIALSNSEFSRFGIQQIILICRLYSIKNPLIKRAVKISSMYVFGRGFEIVSADERTNKAMQGFLRENAKELSHTGVTEKEATLLTDGNLFFVFFGSPARGIDAIRTIDATEIQQIVCNPEDASEEWFFERQWTSETFDTGSGTLQQHQKRAWYPAIRYDPTVHPPSIQGAEVMWDSPVYHVKYGGLKHWKFGCPDIYGAIDWARAYRSFLEDWATINRALARFSWNLETKGGAQAIQQFASTLTTTLANGGTMVEHNPPPTTGAAFVTGPGNKLTPMSTGSSQGDPERGRRILLMAAAAIGLPETFFGDASTGSLATAKSLDRPTELKFAERQQHWREIFTEIFSFVLERSSVAPGGSMREAAALESDSMRPADEKKDWDIIVKFPAILEHDIGEMISSIVTAATLNGFEPAGTIDFKSVCLALMAELGIEDPEKVFAGMYPHFDPLQGDGTAQPDDEPEPGDNPPPRSPRLPAMNAEARLLGEAVRALNKASKALAATNRS